MSNTNKSSDLLSKVNDALEAKASAHNARYESKVSVEQLKSVFNRGLAATDWVFRAGKSKFQWAFARVNNFLYMHEGKLVNKFYRLADRDIANNQQMFASEKEGEGFYDYRELDFAVARLDIKKAGITEEEAEVQLDGLVGLPLQSEVDE